MRFWRNFDVLKSAFLIVASVVGAGFASGKELASYFAMFGAAAFPAAALCGILIFLAAFVIIQSVSKIKPQSIEDYNKALFGRFSPIADIVTLFNFFIVAAAMIAATDSLFLFFGFEFPLFGLITCALCYFAIVGGTKRLLNLNLILVPILIAVTVIVSMGGALNISAEPAPLIVNPFMLIYNCINYVSFNILIASGAIITIKLPQERQTKGAALAGIIIAALMGVVIFGILAGGIATLRSEMPVMQLAAASNMSILAGVVIWLGIFTSLVACVLAANDWAKGLIKNKYISAAAVIAASYAASRLGFSVIVEFVYPVSGVFGMVFIVAAAWYCRKRVSFAPRLLLDKE